MKEGKKMPYSEKCAIVLNKMKPDDVLISPFIQKHLDAKALVELQHIWQEGIKPIPEDTPSSNTLKLLLNRRRVINSSWII